MKTPCTLRVLASLVCFGAMAAHPGLSGVAQAAPEADPAELPDADIVAVAVLQAAPEELMAMASDLEQLEDLWPEGCTRDWVHGTVHKGPGASAQLVYTMGPMKRRLAVTVSRVEAGRLVELDHAGNRGFTTRFLFTPGELGTSVELHTWMNLPPKPFRKIYVNKVQPPWQACQAGVLEALGAAAAAP